MICHMLRGLLYTNQMISLLELNLYSGIISINVYIHYQQRGNENIHFIFYSVLIIEILQIVCFSSINRHTTDCMFLQHKQAYYRLYVSPA